MTTHTPGVLGILGAEVGRPVAVDTLDECRWLLRTTAVQPAGNTSYTSRSGTVVRHIWRRGGELWLEVLDRAAGVSHGRVSSPDEVEQVITALALEDRVILIPAAYLEKDLVVDRPDTFVLAVVDGELLARIGHYWMIDFIQRGRPIAGRVP